MYKETSLSYTQYIFCTVAGWPSSKILHYRTWIPQNAKKEVVKKFWWKDALQWVLPSPKIAPFPGGVQAPTWNMVPWAHLNLQPKQHLDWFNHYSTDASQNVNFLHLIWSIASSFFSLHAWQSSRTTSHQVLFGLPHGLGPSTSYSMNFFTQPSSSFHSTCPYHRRLFCCNTNATSSIPNLSLSSSLGNLSFSLMQHTHLIILISAHWSATSFSSLTGQISLPCNILLCTQLLWPSNILKFHTLINKQYSELAICLQCFDAVGWATGRASGL